MEWITLNEIEAVIKLVPNGITQDGKFRFSIILAIDSINDELKQLSYKCLMEAAAKIDGLLDVKQFDSNFGIYLKTGNETIKLNLNSFNIKGSSFDQSNGGSQWKNFFSNPDNKIVINKFKVSDDFTNPDNLFEFVYDDKIECCDKRCEDDAFIDGIFEFKAPKCDTREDLLNRIDLVDRNFDKVENFYDNSYINKKDQISELSDGKTFLFSDILSQIYQHPQLNGKQYGVSLDLELTIDDLSLFNNKNGQLIFTRKDCSNTFIRPEVIDNGEDGILMHDGKEECILSIYDDYIINQVEVSGQLLPKYYHGRSDYGLVSLKLPKNSKNPHNKYEWKFLSKIQDWNNQLATTSEGLDKNNAEKVEGIILYHKLNNEDYIKVFQEIGVNGHEILCQVGDDSNGHIGSLCERKVIYNLSSNNEKLSLEERSSIKIDTAVIMENNLDLKSNEVFKWEGYNLCLPKSGNKIKENETNSNQLDDIKDYTRDHDEFEDFFEDYGFTYTHEFINDSNIYLDDPSHLPGLQRKDYTFYILKCDAVTGYRIPLGNLKEDNDSPVLDLATLIKKGLLSDNLKIPYEDSESNSNKFSITPKNSPLYPVHILDRIEHSQSIPEDIEKNDRLVLNEKNVEKGSERFIIPDGISYHFGQITGITDNLFIQANDRAEYLKRAYSIFKRAQVEVPKVYFEDKIKYLPDFRNTHIIIRPGDWKSWMRLRNRYSGEIIGQIFSYRNSFENYFDDLKPYPIKIKSSGSILSNTLEMEFYNGIEFKIPIYSMLNLRLYSANEDENLEYFRNYKEISFANVKEGVEKPAILDYTQPLKAERCLPGKPDNTFTYFTFKLKEDPRRDYLTLLTESKELVDDGISEPKLNSQLETKLKDEFSREIFSTRIGDLETNETKEVFPNKIGVCYKFGSNFLDLIADLNYDPEKPMNLTLLDIEINEKFVLSLRDRFIGRDYNLYINIIKKDQIVSTHHIRKEGKLIVDYQSKKSGLSCDIIYQTKDYNDTVVQEVLFTTSVDIFELPNIDFSEKNINVNRKIEEILILSIQNKKEFNLEFQRFEKTKNIFQPTDCPEYFVYRNEEDNKFKELKFRLKSYSKFKKYYPQTDNYPWSKFSSVGKLSEKDEYIAVVPNNRKPQTPSFNFVPLFYKINEELGKTTENPICIRINRPQSEDLIGVVDAEYDKNSDSFITTQNTSSIARDITKSINGKTIEDNTLKNYLKSLNPLFNSVYYQGEVEIKTNNTSFRLLLFKPHYNYKEKQYQFILPFDYHKFGKLDDPIAKIILARVQQQSINTGEVFNQDDLKVSKFSNAKFIPIRSQRIVSVKKINNTEHLVSIQKNGSGSNVDFENSAFIICYFKPGFDEFKELVPEIVPIELPGETTADFLLIDHDLKNEHIIKAADSNAKIGSIGVFEIEKHNDTVHAISNLKNGKIDFNNHPLLRVIYAESFFYK